MDWGFIGWLVIGIIAGWAAGHITRGRGCGIIENIVVGVIGAVMVASFQPGRAIKHGFHRFYHSGNYWAVVPST